MSGDVAGHIGPPADGGDEGIETPTGERYLRFKHIDPPGRCPDCGVQQGGFHHLECDWERCPKCEGQMITCGCFPSRLALFEPGKKGHK